MAQRWSTSLPRRGSRVRFPSRALKKETDWWNTNRSLFFEPCRGSKFDCLRSAPVVARPTSPGRCATSRAQYYISGFVSRLPARSALSFKVLFYNISMAYLPAFSQELISSHIFILILISGCHCFCSGLNSNEKRAFTISH